MRMSVMLWGGGGGLVGEEYMMKIFVNCLKFINLLEPLKV